MVFGFLLKDFNILFFPFDKRIVVDAFINKIKPQDYYSQRNIIPQLISPE
jgi:hypothetical protein